MGREGERDFSFVVVGCYLFILVSILDCRCCCIEDARGGLLAESLVVAA